mmetsp:Transcript_31464/g.68894  ORF Transcript_31464/g.68894 Transcript_31464/m.68894 type:complete len:107 (-) Transcript_31464:38-358(-)
MKVICLLSTGAAALVLRARDLPSKEGSFYSSKADACTVCHAQAATFEDGGADAWNQYCICYAANTAALEHNQEDRTDKEDWVWACTVDQSVIGRNYKECPAAEEAN